MTVWVLMLLAAGDAVVINKIFCPRRRGGCCYRRGLNHLAFTIHNDDIIIRAVDLTLQDRVSVETLQEAPSVTLNSSIWFEWRLGVLVYSSVVAL